MPNHRSLLIGAMQLAITLSLLQLSPSARGQTLANKWKIQDPDLPLITISAGAVEIGVRYKQSGDQTKREKTVRTIDYKQTAISTFSSDTTSTTTQLRDSARKRTANFGVDFVTQTFTGGGSVSIDAESQDKFNSVHVDHRRYEVINNLLEQSVTTLDTEQLVQVSFDADDGFLRTELILTNRSQKTVILSEIAVSILAAGFFGNEEESIWTLTLGTESSGLPKPATGDKPLSISVPPTPIGKPIRQAIYVEKLPTDEIRKLLTQRRLFRVQVNSAKYTDPANDVEIRIADRLAELEQKSIVVRTIDSNGDETRYVSSSSQTEPIAINVLLRLLDADAEFSGSGSRMYLKRFRGLETKFSNWERNSDEFRAAKESDGAWTVSASLPNAPDNGNSSFDTMLQPGARVTLAYLKKSEIVATATSVILAGGTFLRDCHGDVEAAPPPKKIKEGPPPVFEENKEIPQFCIRSVRPDDLVRVDGRAWSTGGSEVRQVGAAETVDVFLKEYPAATHDFVRASLTWAKATMSVPAPVVKSLSGSDAMGEFAVKIGNGPTMKIGELAAAGRVTITSFPDGWFSLSFLMPRTSDSKPAWVCFREQLSPRKHSIGRALNFDTASWNDSCPAGGCSPQHQWLLHQWKAAYPRRERNVIEGRAYHLLVRHFRRVATEAEYFGTVRPVAADSIQRFLAAGTNTAPKANQKVAETSCPGVTWPEAFGSLHK